MILGALIDVGLPLTDLTAELASLPLHGYKISAEKVKRGVLSGTQVKVEIDHTREPSYRSVAEISEIITASALSHKVKQQSLAIYRRLAVAEAKVHSVPAEKVTLHELGATDAIIDIVGAVAGFHLLGVEGFFASPLPYGSGWVQSAHGMLPLPAPATLELLAMAKAPLQPEGDNLNLGELVTPTGAAIITTLASFQRPSFRVEGIGYGAGSRELDTIPNLLRLWIGEQEVSQPRSDLLLVETNIDDMSPELYSYVLERLFAQGAYDVWFTPIQMKKNRPATMLSVLAPPEIEGKVVETILRETSTLGVRVQPIKRHESERQELKFKSSLGTVTVKLKKLGDANISVSPEYEDCRRLALEHNIPLQKIYRIVIGEYERTLS